MKPEFTNANFVRSHGKNPGGYGNWAFQNATSRYAFDNELFGPVLFFSGTLTDARRLAAAAGMTGVVAVLP